MHNKVIPSSIPLPSNDTDHTIHGKKALPAELKKRISCPISGDIFLDPVTLDACGHVIENEEIEKLFRLALAENKNFIACPCCRATVKKTTRALTVTSIIEELAKDYYIDPADIYTQKTPSKVNINANSNSSSTPLVTAGTFLPMPQATVQPMIQSAGIGRGTETNGIKLPKAVILMYPFSLKESPLDTFSNNRRYTAYALGRNSFSFWRYTEDAAASVACQNFLATSLLDNTDNMLKVACRHNIILFFPHDDQQDPVSDILRRISALSLSYRGLSPIGLNIRYQADDDTFIPSLTTDVVLGCPPSIRIGERSERSLTGIKIQSIFEQLIDQADEQLNAWASNLNVIPDPLTMTNQYGPIILPKPRVCCTIM